MHNIVNSESTDIYLESEGIYGYSGWLLGNDVFERKYRFALFENDYWRVILYYNPADMSHHLPQDSLGFIFKGKEIIYAIADGVSIVGGTHDNLSGKVSLDLMKASLSQNKNDHYESIKNIYASKRLKGASTLQFGKVGTTAIEAHFFGPIEDLGLSYFLGENQKLVNFLSDGYDFFPQSWTPKRVMLDNLSLKGVIASTDGAKFNENDSLLLLSFISRENSKEEICQKIRELIPSSEDDQSVMLAVRR